MPRASNASTSSTASRTSCASSTRCAIMSRPSPAARPIAPTPRTPRRRMPSCPARNAPRLIFSTVPRRAGRNCLPCSTNRPNSSARCSAMSWPHAFSPVTACSGCRCVRTWASLIVPRATRLDGVISGEHGIGITKLQYLAAESVTAFSAYKQKIDPHGHFNRGKLLPGADLSRAWTPSLRLVPEEAIILEASALGELNDAIRHCLRCGKCKPVCTTHVPRANLLYSPRNKILATGLIIEAFLYEEQKRRGISLRHFADLTDVAAHCTVCHKCLSP